MLKKNYTYVLCLGLLFGYPLSPVAAEAGKKKVTLPLSEYLALVEKAEANEKLAAAGAKNREKPLAEVALERIVLRLEEKEAKLESLFEVLIQGEPIQPVWLPLAGYAAKVHLQKLGPNGVWEPAPTASLTAFVGKDGGKVLLTREPGRFRVEAESRLPLGIEGGKIELQLLKVAAPVASAEIDLPAELEWSSPGSVVVGESISGGRRHVRLATQRGTATLLRAQRRFAQGENKALAHAVLLTLLQLRPEGLRRHDVVFYEVSRGQLSSFEVTLPPGLEIEDAATDEGLMVPSSEGTTLRIERRNQLLGTGYLVLSSTPDATDELLWSRVEPKVEVRARYLAFSSSLAAEIAPEPAKSFSQIDLSDLPPLLGQALGAVRLAAAWRLQDAAAPASLRIAALPAAQTLDTTVLERETTTLLTVDGTLLHHETFTLAPSARPASYFEVTPPLDASLWSAKVNDQPTRPLTRGGKWVLPIVSSPGQETILEVISVLEKAVPPGRSQLELELARVGAPVLEHRWRLLLPDGPLYRFTSSQLDRVPAEDVLYELGTAQGPKGRLAHGNSGIVGVITDEGGIPLPGVTVTLAGKAGTLIAITNGAGGFRFEGLPTGGYRIETSLEGFGDGIYELILGHERKVVDLTMRPGIYEEIVIQSESPLLDSRRVQQDKDLESAKKEKDLAAANYRMQVGELKQGLVSGVKPLPITIPESGKTLMLTGILPPERISVTIEVKARKEPGR